MIKRKGKYWSVECYNPQTGKTEYVKASDHGMTPPKNERQAKTLERAALEARDLSTGTSNETCDRFTKRWVKDYPRPAESTNLLLIERTKKFGEDFQGVPMRKVTHEAARIWAENNFSRVREVRTMFNQAKKVGIINHEPFSGLGVDKRRGRHNIVVLTLDELKLLEQTTVEVHGDKWGSEFAAMICWAAHTCMRPGEIFAARWSRLNGDTYDLKYQYNSKVGRETIPKHNSVGEIYVPERVIQVLSALPRRTGDDLIFRTKRGKQFRTGSLFYAWSAVRTAFVAKLPEHHDLKRRLREDPEDWIDFYELRHFGASYLLNVRELEPWIVAQQLRHRGGDQLILELYGHPERKKAIERMRRADQGKTSAVSRDFPANQAQDPSNPLPLLEQQAS